MPDGTLHYATYFDRHFLRRGLALYRSLARHSPPFVLWVLCLDDETHRTLSRMQLANAVLIPITELEQADNELLGVKRGRRRIEYYWTCGPSFLLHILGRCPRVDMITYLDADLFFFSDPTPIYDELGSNSILLIEHRWPSFANRDASYGIYNVGMLVFRRTREGLACLRWWRQRCIEWCFERVQAGRYGDQKYLDDWPTRFERVMVLRHKGAGVAPWNFVNHRFQFHAGQLFVDEDRLIFSHINGFEIINRWLYDPDAGGRGYGPQPVVRRHIYLPYIREVRAAAEMIWAAGGRVYTADNLRYGRNKLSSLIRMVRHRSFLVVMGPLVF